MMMNRRKTVLGIIAAWSALLARTSFGKNLPSNPLKNPAASASVPSAANSDAVEKALREDLARFKSRAYSDEGIPVFLACEDLAGVKSGSPAVPASTLSQRVAADLRKNGQAWLRIYPSAPATDVSKVIEVLADRDFHRGGTRNKL